MSTWSETCPTCGGEGYVGGLVISDDLDVPTVDEICYRCKGKGVVPAPVEQVMTNRLRAVVIHAIRYVSTEVQQEADLREDVYKELLHAVRHLTTEERDEVMR